MSTNFIELLKDHVSPIVLNGETEQLFEKDQALSKFLPILLTIFKNRPEWFESLRHQLNPHLSEIFVGENTLKQQLLNQLSSTVRSDELEHTLDQSLTPTIGFLEAQAGGTDATAVSHLLETHADSIHSALPIWAGPILASLGISQYSNKVLNQQPSAVAANRYAEEDKKGSFWLPFIIFLILAAIALFLYKSCTNKKDEQAVVPAAQTVTDQPAALQLTTGSNAEVTNCSIYLNNPNYVQTLQNEIKQIFNHTAGCGVDGSASYHSSFTDQDTIPSILKLVKGIPNLSLNWVGDQLNITAANPADADRVAGEIRQLAKNLTVTTNSQTVSQSPASSVDEMVSSANNQAEQALAAIKTDNVKALDVATALNMQIINFATASSEIPDVNKSILDQAAALLKRASNVHLKVVGHTDASGDAAKNKALSQDRAQAIVNYLTAQGVDPAQLQAVGVGAEQPRADNETEEGRFKNRRIEFEVLNTDTGVVRSVDDEGIQKK